MSRSKNQETFQMAKCMAFDVQDRLVLRALDTDFVISADGETATVTGEMEVKIVPVEHTHQSETEPAGRERQRRA
jgi:hypothetical protein